MRDVAGYAGVSVGTVSRVLNGHRVAPALIQKVHEAVEVLAYVRNDAARQLRVGRPRSNVLGLVIEGVADAFVVEVISELRELASRDGWVILVVFLEAEEARPMESIDLLVGHQVAGVLLATSAFTGLVRARLLTGEVPVVVVSRNRAIDGSREGPAGYVDSAYRSLAHLVAPNTPKV